MNEPTVWEYEREDFMTTKPYEELYQFHVQPFVHATQMESLAAYAASKGFRGFKSMYKKYVESLKAQSGTLYIENVTQFTNQPLELNAGEWEADDLGIHKKNGFNDEIACPHPIMPVERLVNIDTGEEKLQLAYRKGAVWRHLIVSKTVLASSNKVTDLAGSGIAVNSQNARAFIQYISDMENLNYDLIPEKKSIGRFGYIPDAGFSPFVDGLIFDGDANFKAMFQTVRSRGSEAKWLETAAEVRSMSITARIILAASFASVLLEPLNCLPFFVHLWGVDSGTGKTVALMVAASVWGDPAVGAYVKTFDGTVVGMEKTAAFLNNLPFCLDELQLAKDNKKFQYKVVQKGGSATLFGASIEWLNLAGVVLKCQRINQAFEPIAVYADLSAFKLYMGDVGLLTMKSGISQQTVLSGEGNTFMGALTENYVAQQLAAKGYDLYYWESSSTAELDFVLQKGSQIIGVEVKKGEHVRSRSLSVFVSNYKPAYSIRLSLKNFGEKDGLKAIPLYAVFCV